MSADLRPLVPLPQPMREKLRDLLADKLRSKSVDQIVNELVDSLIDHKATVDPFLRRRKWCLAQIHTREELATVVREGLKSFAGLNGLGELGESSPVGKTSASGATRVAGQSGEPDGLSGNDPYTADLFDAWFGIATLKDREGGTGWGSADDISWGEQLGDESFDRIEDALGFAGDLTKEGIENTGVYLGADGKWHVTFDPNSSD
jgi:hypothetical protein